jgi:DNA polymerase-3 subunit epsilon
MREYLLFIDTEATGLPKKWNQPYSNTKNWPHIVQLAWVVYNSAGNEIKKESHYIYEYDFKISAQAQKIHGINQQLLLDKGKPRAFVLDLLASDLHKYQPMLVGHFMELDLHLLNADFYRAGIDSCLQNLPMFCTMLASTKYVKNHGVSHLRLGELFTLLFDKKAPNMHNALGDAYATALSFFELIKRGDITPQLIEQQQQIISKKQYHDDNYIKWAYCTFVTVLLSLIIYLLWITR